jgi:hypothetical protein
LEQARGELEPFSKNNRKILPHRDLALTSMGLGDKTLHFLYEGEGRDPIEKDAMDAL